MNKKEYICPAILLREVYLSMAVLSPLDDEAKLDPFERAPNGLIDDLHIIDVENDGSIWGNSID